MKFILQLLQKIQTLTDAPEEKPCIKTRGVKTFEQNEDVYIFLVLPEYHIFSFSTAPQKLLTGFPEDKISYIYPNLQIQKFSRPGS